MNTCNYLLDDLIMFGAYPCCEKDASFLLEDRQRDVFINLCESHEIEKMYDYRKYILGKSKFSVFVHFPIIDMQTPQKNIEFSKFMNFIYFMYYQGKRLYIHCMGGHGRSGVICGCLLRKLGHSASDTLLLLQQSHKQRRIAPDFPCPITDAQKIFVIDY